MTARLPILTGALAALTSAAVLSQTPPQAPPRDQPRVTVTGTATIKGTIVTDDDKRIPLRRVEVHLSRVGLEDRRVVSSDDQGQYRFDLLPAGSYRLNFSKGAYIAMEYGAPRAGQPGHLVTVANGEVFVAEPVVLLKGAVIAGRVMDSSGRPVARVGVHASQSVEINGVRQSRFGSGTDGIGVTNEHGEYRIFGLLPGEYVVCVDRPGAIAPDPVTPAAFRAIDQPSRPATSRERASRLAPTLFPGTTNAAAAQPIVLARGEERLGVDLPVQLVPVSEISGIVTGLDGRPAVRATVSTSPKAFLPFAFPERVQTTTDANGRFTLAGLMPGDYVVTARVTAAPGTAGPRVSWALAEVPAFGQDVSGLTLALQPAMTASGRIVAQGATPPPWPMNNVRMAFVPDVRLNLGLNPLASPRVTVNADGTFTADGMMPGAYRLHVTVPAVPDTQWTVRSATLGDRDLLDTTIDVRPGVNLSDLIVTLTDVPSQLSGRIITADGRPARHLYVIAFSTDAADWWLGSRRIKSVETLENGSYQIDGLPAGEYYVSALAEWDDQLMYEPPYLRELVAGSIKITIGDGGKKTQDLQVRK